MARLPKPAAPEKSKASEARLHFSSTNPKHLGHWQAFSGFGAFKGVIMKNGLRPKFNSSA